MDWEHGKLSQEEFNKKVNLMKNFQKRTCIFLMNTLNLIIHNGHHYCFCKKILLTK